MTRPTNLRLASFLLLFLLVVLGTLLILRTTPEGLGLSDDSIAYVAGARSMLAGDGYREAWLASNGPVTHFPPGFSSDLAFFGLFGLDPLRGTRLVNALLFGLSAITGTATSNTWTTSGTGTFSNANALTTTYMPSPADIASGIVTLTLTANNPSGPCPVATDQMIVNFDPNPFTANAGANQTVCTGTAASLNGQLTGTNLASWTASVPGGSFSPNANSAIVTYIPPAGFGGNIDLILTTNDQPNTCPPVSDQLTLTVETNPFSVSAGANQTVCQAVSTTQVTSLLHSSPLG